MIGLEGSDIRELISDAVWEVGVRARRLRGRLERGSAEVGIEAGVGSDIVRVWGCSDRPFRGALLVY